MPKFTVTNEENERFELLKAGAYPFEVVGYDADISKSPKTKGCDQADLKIRFFQDATFTKPVAQWTETITFPDESLKKDLAVFLRGQINAFVKSTGMGDAGQEVEFDELSLVGLRGWAWVLQEGVREKVTNAKGQDEWVTKKEDGHPVLRNKVDRYLAPKDKQWSSLPRAPRQVETDAKPADDWS